MRPFEATVEILKSMVSEKVISPAEGNGKVLGQFARELYDALKEIHENDVKSFEAKR